MPAAAALSMDVQAAVSTVPVEWNARGITKLFPEEARHEAVEEERVALTSTPNSEFEGTGGLPPTQHCRSEGPVQ